MHKQISIFIKDSNETRLFNMTGFGIEDNLIGVSVAMTEEDFKEPMTNVGIQLGVHIRDLISHTLDESKKVNLHNAFVEWVEAMEVDLRSPIPKVIKGDLRKKVSECAVAIRAGQDPMNAIQAELINTSEGYLLTLSVCDFQIFSDLVAPVYEVSPVTEPVAEPVVLPAVEADSVQQPASCQNVDDVLTMEELDALNLTIGTKLKHTDLPAPAKPVDRVWRSSISLF